MTTITRGNFPGDLKPVVKYYFGMGLDDHEKLYEAMFDKETTTDAYEDYAVAVGLGAAVIKDEGSAITYSAGQELFRKVQRVYTYGLGVRFTREMIDDGKVLKFAQRYARELGEAVRINREVRAASVLNRAFEQYPTLTRKTTDVLNEYNHKQLVSFLAQLYQHYFAQIKL